MTGATSNITTHWTFKDGRDYVLSLNTTEMPNTIAFWVSDKVTGEEWTSCYDENAIEILTKRTGCYKNFQTFLCMVKSALLKKSDSVAIDLLNLEDLAAISMQRQNSSSSSTSTPNNNFLSVPPNFHLYSGEPSSPLGGGGSGSRHVKSQRATDPNNRSNTALLNKRKYLIITYIAEFDRVHYPLPLNYSCPPDLNVMQNNIVKLKAEVTSLKSANKELVSRMELIRSSSTDTALPKAMNCIAGLKTSQECNATTSTITAIDVGCSAMSKTEIESTTSAEIQNVFVRKTDMEKQKEARNNDNNTVSHQTNPGKDLNNNDIKDGQSGAPVVASDGSSCTKCAVYISSLQAKIHELQDCISFQRDRHLESMEKLENENHFLRHKVEAAEKYELELWSQILQLKEKVSQKEETERKRLSQLRSTNTQSQRQRQSRHDLFYNACGGQPTVQQTIKNSPSPVPATSNRTKTNSSGNTKDRSLSRAFSGKTGVRRETNRSTSTSSTASSKSVNTKVNRIQSRSKEKNNAGSRRMTTSKSPKVCRSRGSTASIGSTGFQQRVSSSSRSSSPASRFDPTAYINEKKQKQSKIANLRLQKLEARARAGSNAHTQGPSSGKRSAESSPLPTRRNQQTRSMSAGNDNETKAKSNMDTGNILSKLNGYIGDSKSYKFSSLKPAIPGNTPARSRSSSGSGKTRILSTIRFPIPTTEPKKAKQSPIKKFTPQSGTTATFFSPSTFVSDFVQELHDKLGKNTTVGRSKSPTHRCRQLNPSQTQKGTGLDFRTYYSRKPKNADATTMKQVQQSMRQKYFE